MFKTLLSKIIVTVIVLLLIVVGFKIKSLNDGGPTKMTASRVHELSVLINEKKFVATQFYPGATSESDRIKFEAELNGFIQKLIDKDAEIKSKNQLLEMMRTFLYSSSPSDTEDRGCLASYMEKILDIYSVSSSDGLLNKWMYEFDPNKSPK